MTPILRLGALLTLLATAPAAGQDPASSPPGRGLAEHPFLHCGEWDTRHPVQTTGFEIHTAQPIGLDRVLVMQNGDPATLLVIEKATGRVVTRLVLRTRRPDQPHGQFRHVRMTRAGTFLVAHMDLGRVVEYEKLARRSGRSRRPRHGPRSACETATRSSAATSRATSER